jgi:hypothetical protein
MGSPGFSTNVLKINMERQSKNKLKHLAVTIGHGNQTRVGL